MPHSIKLTSKGNKHKFGLTISLPRSIIDLKRFCRVNSQLLLSDEEYTFAIKAGLKDLVEKGLVKESLVTRAAKAVTKAQVKPKVAIAEEPAKVEEPVKVEEPAKVEEPVEEQKTILEIQDEVIGGAEEQEEIPVTTSKKKKGKK